jgi:hypothetical protein
MLPDHSGRSRRRPPTRLASQITVIAPKCAVYSARGREHYVRQERRPSRQICRSAPDHRAPNARTERRQMRGARRARTARMRSWPSTVQNAGYGRDDDGSAVGALCGVALLTFGPERQIWVCQLNPKAV